MNRPVIVLSSNQNIADGAVDLIQKTFGYELVRGFTLESKVLEGLCPSLIVFTGDAVWSPFYPMTLKMMARTSHKVRAPIIRLDVML